MPTIQAIFERVVEKYDLGINVPNADWGAVAAGSVTSVKWLRNANWGSGHFQGLEAIIHRPLSASPPADVVRYASTLTASTGVLAPDTNWADTDKSGEYFRVLYYGLHPEFFYKAIGRALRKAHFQNQIYVSQAADADMQSSATSSYTESDSDGGPATTFTKVTTAGNVFSGIRAGRIANAAADGYIRQRFNVVPGETVFVACIVRADVGTFGLYLQDMTNAAAIGTAVNYNGEAWAYVWRQETVPSGCEILEVRLQGEEDTADIYVDGLWVHRTETRRVYLPSTVNEAFEFEALSFACFPQGISSGVCAADSIEVVEVPRQRNFSANFLPPEANPSFIQFHASGLLGNPLILQGRRPYADVLTSQSDETENTACDLELASALTMLELVEAHRMRIPQADVLAARAEQDMKGYARRQTVEGPAARKPAYAMGGLAN